MSTGRQVDYLCWAVVESEVRCPASYRVGDGFVTEWQPAAGLSLSR